METCNVCVAATLRFTLLLLLAQQQLPIMDNPSKRLRPPLATGTSPQFPDLSSCRRESFGHSKCSRARWLFNFASTKLKASLKDAIACKDRRRMSAWGLPADSLFSWTLQAWHAVGTLQALKEQTGSRSDQRTAAQKLSWRRRRGASGEPLGIALLLLALSWHR
jgi:hypothetical protein